MAETRGPILAVDDNADSLFTLEQILSCNGYEVVTASSGEEAYEKALLVKPSVVLLDVVMPRVDGFTVTEQLKAHPELRFVPVILLTARDELEDIITGLDRGADDYIKKPFRPEELLARLRAAERLHAVYGELRQSEEQKELLLAELSDRYDFSHLVGKSQPMQQLFSLMRKIVDVDLPVLIVGPTGSGKELVAKAIHYNSHRSEGAFVAQSAAAFHENLLESDLFGHLRGAFTGAVRDKRGLLEVAHRGSLFLDEVAEMAPAMQAKLLRVLQEGVFLPLGGTTERRVDLRVIVATNRDLEQMVAEGHFREDLYYRLNAITIRVPALAERAEDIPLLIEHFLQRECQRMQLPRKNLSSEALDTLLRYSWRGNVRELENEIGRMFALGRDDSELGTELISPRIIAEVRSKASVEEHEGELQHALSTVERSLIEKTLLQCGWNKSATARKLGMSRSNLLAKIKFFGLEPTSNRLLGH